MGWIQRRVAAREDAVWAVAEGELGPQVRVNWIYAAHGNPMFGDFKLLGPLLLSATHLSWCPPASEPIHIPLTVIKALRVNPSPLSFDLKCSPPHPELSELNIRFKLDVPGQGASAEKLKDKFVDDLISSLSFTENADPQTS